MIRPTRHWFAQLGMIFIIPLLLGNCVPSVPGEEGEEKPYEVHLSKKWGEFAKLKKTFSSQGRLLTDAEIDDVTGTSYGGIWHQRNEEHILWHEKTWPRFYDKLEELRQQGYGLVDLEINNNGGGSVGGGVDFWGSLDIFSGSSDEEVSDEPTLQGNVGELMGVFSRDEPQTTYRFAQSLKKFVANKQEMDRDGFRLIDIEVFLGPAGENCYAALWKPGRTEQLTKVDRLSPNLAPIVNQMREDGWRMSDIEIFWEKGQRHFFGLWEKADDDEQVLTLMNYSQFSGKVEELRNNGLILIDLEVDAYRGNTVYSGIWRGKARSSEGLRRIFRLEYDGSTEREGDPGERF